MLVLDVKFGYLKQSKQSLQLKKSPKIICAFERIADSEMTCLPKPWLYKTLRRKEVFLIRCHNTV